MTRKWKSRTRPAVAHHDARSCSPQSGYHEIRTHGHPYHSDQAEQNPLQHIGLLFASFTMEPGDHGRRGDRTAHERQHQVEDLVTVLAELALLVEHVHQSQKARAGDGSADHDLRHAPPDQLLQIRRRLDAPAR